MWLSSRLTAEGYSVCVCLFVLQRRTGHCWRRMPPHATFCTTTQLEMPLQVNALTMREILVDVKRLKPVGTQITGACSLCSQNIVAALMVAGVMRVVCVTVLSSRHLETAVRSVSNTHSIEHNTAEKYEQRHIYQFHDTKLCQNILPGNIQLIDKSQR